MATIAKLVVDLEMNDSGFDKGIGRSGKSLEAWGKRLMATGAIITGAFAAPIIAGSKAAWGQVDAVEQATVALRAYESDADAVNKVLADLIAYARSDLGVLFQRQDLFNAAQGLKIMGAETENLVEYVEIMSRSVGLGVGNWDELQRVIGRVGSTGRLTGDDFDMLTKMGYQLDDSLRNTNITWEELFAHLDKGIPADALAGQADTIRGKSIRLQSALRGLGLAFLGVDSETSKFIEGGLGWQMMRGMERLTELMKRAAPAVQGFGSVIAAILRPLGTLFDWLLRLPQPVQTAMLMFTAFSGIAMTFSGGLLLMLPRIASTIAAFQSLGGLSGVLGGVATAIRAIGTASLALFANPVILAGALAIGALFAAYKTNFMGFGDSVDHALGKLGSFTDALDVLLGKPGKNVEVTASFDGNAHYIQEITLPDGTKKWDIVEDETGGTFGTILESYTDEENPRIAHIKIQPDGDGEAFWTTVDLDTGKIESVEIEVVADTSKAIEDMAALEKAALAVRSIFILVSDRAREFGVVLSVLRQQFRPVIQFAQDAYNFFNPLGAVVDQVGGFFKTLNAILLGDWGSISWESVMDATGLGVVYDLVVALADGYDRLKGAWDSWTSRDSGDADTGMDTHEGQPDPFPDGESLGFEGNTGGLRGMAQDLLAATDAAGSFSGAMAGLGVESAKSRDSLAGAAAIIPPYTSATNAADAATGAMAGNMGRSFSQVATAALSNFSSMRSSAVAEATGMQSAVNQRMAAMQLATGLQMLNMRNSAVTQATSMSSTVGLRMSAMQMAAGLQMASMASTAATTGSRMNTGLTGWLAGAIARVSASMLSIVSTVRGIASSGYNAGYYAGSQISAGFANGMMAYLGQIRAAGNAMVAEASRAVVARAMISSPSRLFMQYGEYIGEGLEIGMRRSIPSIGRAADAMIPQPAFNSPIGGGGFGGTTINNYYQQDVKVLRSEEWEAYKQKSDRANSYVDARQRGAHRGGYERNGR